mmetsp:Transcript_258/g.635  ORF Transcript_258/g.635 Transcript_258/m.635 type:complete len:226 (-) Transcript_258:1003-1680(-)
MRPQARAALRLDRRGHATARRRGHEPHAPRVTRVGARRCYRRGVFDGRPRRVARRCLTERPRGLDRPRHGGPATVSFEGASNVDVRPAARRHTKGRRARAGRRVRRVLRRGRAGDVPQGPARSEWRRRVLRFADGGGPGTGGVGSIGRARAGFGRGIWEGAGQRRPRPASSGAAARGATPASHGRRIRIITKGRPGGLEGRAGRVRRPRAARRTYRRFTRGVGEG